MMRNLSYDNFIYINEKYKSELDKLLSDKYIISENGCRALTKALSTLICSVCEDNEILEKNYNKMLYHLSLCYYYLNNIEPDFNYIKEIKRIQYQTVRQEYLDRCVEIMH
jgi:hydroxymethylpyrimidine pyrophosphatase-like HAD family hydrolase